MAIFGLIGSGGFAREVMPLLRGARTPDGEFIESVFFVVPRIEQPAVNGYPVITEEDFLAHPGRKLFNIAIGDSRKREAIAGVCESHGCEPYSILSPHSLWYDACGAGPGAIFCAFSMATSNARVGKYFHANIYSYVAHDCIVGDYVTFAPGVKCNGNVHVGDHAYIGTGAVLRHGSADKPLSIGAGATVGMGAVVTKDVPAGATVVGNPARLKEKA